MNRQQRRKAASSSRNKKPQAGAQSGIEVTADPKSDTGRPSWALRASAKLLLSGWVLRRVRHPTARMALAMVAREVGKHDLARKLDGTTSSAPPKASNAQPVAPAVDTLLADAMQRHRAGRLAEAETLYRTVIEAQPGHAEAHSSLGVALTELGRAAEAEAVLRTALTLRQQYPEAQANLGFALMELGRLDEAAECLKEALAANAKMPEALTTLGVLLTRRGKLQEAQEAHRSAIGLRPRYAAAHTNLGITLMNAGLLDEAITSLRTALGLAPERPEIHFALGLALLRRGNYQEGWPEFEWRRRGGDRYNRPREFAQPAWEGEDLGGRTILIHAEQGLGDTLHFVRYVPMVPARGGRVVLEVQAPLKRLLEGLPGIAGVYAVGELLPDFDVHLPLMSLPYMFQTTLANIPADVPYLRPLASARSAWQSRLSQLPGLKVGLAWAGNERNAAIDPYRSIALAQLAPLIAIRGVSFVSLQKGPAATQLAAMPAETRPLDFMDEVVDMADTAAIIASLDLVVTVDTAVAHLAGALGKPVWILSRFDGDWRWLTDREDSPWYPTARLFRQRNLGDWEGAVSAAAEMLAELAASRKAPA